MNPCAFCGKPTKGILRWIIEDQLVGESPSCAECAGKLVRGEIEVELNPVDELKPGEVIVEGINDGLPVQ